MSVGTRGKVASVTIVRDGRVVPSRASVSYNATFSHPPILTRPRSSRTCAHTHTRIQSLSLITPHVYYAVRTALHLSTSHDHSAHHSALQGAPRSLTAQRDRPCQASAPSARPAPLAAFVGSQSPINTHTHTVAGGVSGRGIEARGVRGVVARGASLTCCLTESMYCRLLAFSIVAFVPKCSTKSGP